MTAPQTGTSSGAPAGPYPPRLVKEPPPTEPPLTGQELSGRQLAALALLFPLTAVTLGVIFSSMDVFWDMMRFFLMLYTLLAWVGWLRNWGG